MITKNSKLINFNEFIGQLNKLSNVKLSEGLLFTKYNCPYILGENYLFDDFKIIQVQAIYLLSIFNNLVLGNLTIDTSNTRMSFLSNTSYNYNVNMMDISEENNLSITKNASLNHLSKILEYVNQSNLES